MINTWGVTPDPCVASCMLLARLCFASIRLLPGMLSLSLIPCSGSAMCGAIALRFGRNPTGQGQFDPRSPTFPLPIYMVTVLLQIFLRLSSARISWILRLPTCRGIYLMTWPCQWYLFDFLVRCSAHDFACQWYLFDFLVWCSAHDFEDITMSIVFVSYFSALQCSWFWSCTMMSTLSSYC